MVQRKKTLASQPGRINTTTTEITAHVDRGYLIESWRLAADLRVARASAVKDAALSPDVEIAIAVNVERSKSGLVRDVNRRLPGHSGVGRTVKQSASTIRLIE